MLSNKMKQGIILWAPQMTSQSLAVWIFHQFTTVMLSTGGTLDLIGDMAEDRGILPIGGTPPSKMAEEDITIMAVMEIDPWALDINPTL